MWTRDLSRLEFQLAYLVMLTRRGLKPLSRWEGCLDDEAVELIRSSGLVLDTVTRRTRLGRKSVETIFAHDRRRAAWRRHLVRTERRRLCKALWDRGEPEL